MSSDMTLYFDVVKQIQDQINRITYANQLTEQERSNQLSRLEHDISQKFQWARRSMEAPEYSARPGSRLSAKPSSEFTSEPNTEMDVA